MEYFEETIRLSRGEMDCIRFGSGKKAFVMITGITMAGLVGLGKAVCDAYSPDFGADYTIYVFERLRELPEGYTIRSMAEDIAEAMDALGLRDAYVVGASQGGMIGLELAIAHPGLVHALALASSCAYLDETGTAVMEHWSQLAERNDGVGIYRDFFRRVYTAPDTELLALIENSATAAQCRRFGTLTHACLGFDCRNALQRLRCPVLVLAAGRDLALGSEAQKRTAELLQAEYFCYDDYGHAAYDEAPDYKLRIKTFFDKN